MGFLRPFIAGLVCSVALAAAVDIKPLPAKGMFADAVVPNSFSLVCAPTVGELSASFQERSLPFEERIIRNQKGRVCHLLYEPTVPGFRAAPDNDPISELFLDVRLPGFLSLRVERFGDVLDIARQVLPLIRRPISVNIGMPQNQERQYYDQAVQFHFPNSVHKFAFRENQWDQNNPWVQDYLKSGTADGQAKVLVTRLAFEGREDNAARMRPMLDSLKQEPFVRSKLSWDGGDLQFVRSPKDPAKLLLIHGKSARKYWGSELTPEEYEYVLKVEFGADLAADFSDITSHVDYFVAFLPADNIALVSQPERENFEIAQAAAQVLANHFRNDPQPEIAELQRLLADRASAFGKNLNALRKLLLVIAERSKDWPAPLDPAGAQRIDAYVDANCTANPSDCISPQGIAKLLATDRPLLLDWAKGNAVDLNTTVLGARVASLIESQLPGFRGSVQPIVDRNVLELERLGFRVIRVPRLAGDPVLKPRWPGVSYVNSLIVDQTIFVPEFGLGEAEWALFDRIREQLPPKYRVVPVYARKVLLHNGGLHCVSGLIRSPLGPATE